MATPKDVLWELEPPSIGKHLVLREYLKAWLPILGIHGKRLVFIDGFAGPGKYKGGEDGSPVIALKTAIDHTVKAKLGGVRFLFVEEDPERAGHLDTVVKRMEGSLPSGIKASVHQGSFVDVVGSLLAQLAAAEKEPAPALLMVDPFGVKGVPLQVLADFLKGDKKELLVSFMSEAVRRFGRTGEFEPHLDALFGNREWRRVPDNGNALEGLFEERLRSIGAKHVLRFRVKSGERHIYTLFFATKHPLGCDKMKQAMWKAAPDGSYSYEPGKSAVAPGQLQFLEPQEVDFQAEIRAHLQRTGECSIEQLTEWAQGDGTKYHSGQLKKALKQLEESGYLRIIARGAKRRAGTYPRGTRVELQLLR